MNTMPTKGNLTVLTRKESLLLLILFFIALTFSFTLGLRMGKKLAIAEQSSQASSAHETSEHSSHEPSPEPAHEDPVKNQEIQKSLEQEAHRHTDEVLDQELTNTGVKAGQAVVAELPSQKKLHAQADAQYVLQVGSYRTVAEAAEQVSILKKMQFDAFYLEAELPNKGKWYRVGIGPFLTSDVAEKRGKELKQKNIIPNFIVQKIN